MQSLAWWERNDWRKEGRKSDVGACVCFLFSLMCKCDEPVSVKNNSKPKIWMMSIYGHQVYRKATNFVLFWKWHHANKMRICPDSRQKSVIQCKYRSKKISVLIIFRSSKFEYECTRNKQMNIQWRCVVDYLAKISTLWRKTATPG